MTAEDFVATLKANASEAAVQDVLAILRKPPGKRPAPSAVELAAWFSGLTDTDKNYLERLMRMTAEAAVFGVLAIIDGVRSIEGMGEKGEFELCFKKRDGRLLLNGGDAGFLHDLFKRVTSE